MKKALFTLTLMLLTLCATAQEYKGFADRTGVPTNLGTHTEGEDEKLSEKEVCEKLINIIGIYKEYISSSTNINEILSISADIKKEYDLFLQKYSKQIDTILTGKNRKLRELKNRIGTSVNSLVKFAEKKAEMIKNGGN
jgi:hypothetical protein